MSLTVAGLAIIALAWLIQVGSSWKGRVELRWSFVLLYGIGVAIMVADGARNGLTTEGWLNLLILIFLGLLYLKVHK